MYLNFHERWQKQGKADVSLPSLDSPESLIDIHMTEACMGSSWNCQLFRSITSDSAVFNHGTRSKMHMNPKKGRIVDSSITQAYIQAGTSNDMDISLFFLKYNQGSSPKIEYLESGWKYQCASFKGLKFGIFRIAWLWFQFYKRLHL